MMYIIFYSESEPIRNTVLVIWDTGVVSRVVAQTIINWPYFMRMYFCNNDEFTL